MEPHNSNSLTRVGQGEAKIYVYINFPSANAFRLDVPSSPRTRDEQAEHANTSAARGDRERRAEIERATIRIQAAGRGRRDRRKFAERRDQDREEAQETISNHRWNQRPSRKTRDISGDSERTKGPGGSAEGVGGRAMGIVGSLTKSMSETMNIDKRTVRLIAELVDERLMVR